MSKNFDPYHLWLGIHPGEQPADHYRLLGLRQFEDEPEVIRDAAERQMRHVRSYELGEHGALAHKILNELARAKACLLNAEKQAAYDDQLRQSTRPAAPLTARIETNIGSSFAIGTEQETIRSQTRRKHRRAQPERLPYYVAGGLVLLLGVVVFLLIRPSDGPADGGLAVAERTSPQSGDERKGPVAGKPAAKTGGQPPIESDNKPLEITNSIGMKLVLIPPGEFLMGSPQTEAGRQSHEGPQHRVQITKPFYMGTNELTQRQWVAVMTTTPWKGEKYVREGPDYPASYVSWDDASEFCRRLSAKEGRTYGLPTEAQWEYACRGGSTSRYSFGDSANLLKDYGWFCENAQDVGQKYAHAVGRKRANRYGLFDMHGNVWEWCQDWHGDYPGGSVTDPTGPVWGSNRVRRGGSWLNSSAYCRSAHRNRGYPIYRRLHLGFRIVSFSE